MKFDLEERLINFAVGIIDVVESLPRTRSGNHMAGQLIRSGTSPALNYGEAQSAESRNDFIHKLKIILKELRETRIGLVIIDRKKLSRNHQAIPVIVEECRQLIAIFVKSIKTAELKKH
jgi:four helix bundle protein